MPSTTSSRRTSATVTSSRSPGRTSFDGFARVRLDACGRARGGGRADAPKPPHERRVGDQLGRPAPRLPGLGSPQDLVAKILFQHEILDHHRLLLQLSVGTIPHDRLLRAIELFGTEVAPAVRDAVAQRATGPAAAHS